MGNENTLRHPLSCLISSTAKKAVHMSSGKWRLLWYQ